MKDFYNLIKFLIGKIGLTFRIIVPGTLFIVLLHFAFPDLAKAFNNFAKEYKPDIVFFLLFFSLIFGIIIYVIHRIVFELIDDYLLNFDIEKLSKIFLYVDEIPEKKDSYILFKWASAHLPLIVSELLFVFSYIHDINSFFNVYYNEIRLISVILFSISFIVYLITHLIQIKIYEIKKIL